MNSRVFIPLGFAFFVLGLGLSFIPPYSFTGYIAYSREGTYHFPYGLLFTIIGSVFLVLGIREGKGIESVLISNKALQRSRRDKFILAHLKDYLHEVDRISQNPDARPKETLGEFFVSPRGHKQIRVAWHLEGDVLYIDDFLYHTSGSNTYVDDWGVKARFRKIRREDYESKGYQKN